MEATSSMRASAICKAYPASLRNRARVRGRRLADRPGRAWNRNDCQRGSRRPGRHGPGGAARRTIMIEPNDDGAVTVAASAGGERRRKLLLFLAVTLLVVPPV